MKSRIEKNCAKYLYDCNRTSTKFCHNMIRICDSSNPNLDTQLKDIQHARQNRAALPSRAGVGTGHALENGEGV